MSSAAINTLPHPFDLSIVPENLQAEDPLPQSVAQDAVLSAHLGDLEESARFYTQTPTLRSLNYLKRIYERNEKAKAYKLLSSRNRVQYDDLDYITPPDSLDVNWSTDRHYIDMLVCVGREMGLGAIIPNQQMNSLYAIQLDFRNKTKEFKAKHNRLGFDATGSLLWMGKMPSGDDAWIAFVPESYDLEEEDITLSSTRLSERHYRIALMFFAFVLSQCGYRDIVVHVRYPDLEMSNAISEATNFL
jgi:hypothetical protein